MRLSDLINIIAEDIKNRGDLEVEYVDIMSSRLDSDPEEYLYDNTRD